mgnify:CR=1 FL=1
MKAFDSGGQGKATGEVGLNTKEMFCSLLESMTACKRGEEYRHTVRAGGKGTVDRTVDDTA